MKLTESQLRKIISNVIAEAPRDPEGVQQALENDVADVVAAVKVLVKKGPRLSKKLYKLAEKIEGSDVADKLEGAAFTLDNMFGADPVAQEFEDVIVLDRLLARAQKALSGGFKRTSNNTSLRRFLADEEGETRDRRASAPMKPRRKR